MRLVLAVAFTLATCGDALASDAKAAEDAKTLVAEGVRLHDAGRFDEAIALYDRALARDPGNEGARYEKALSLYAKGARPETIALCRGVLAAKAPSHPGFHVLLGSALQAEGKLADAERVFRDGLALFPRSQPLHFNLALSLVAQKRHADAEDELDASLAIDPTHAASWRALSIACREAKRPLSEYVALARGASLEAPGAARAAAAQRLAAIPLENVTSTPDAPGGEPGTTTIQVARGGSEEQIGEEVAVRMVGASRALPKAAGATEGQFFVDSFASVLGVAADVLPKGERRAWKALALTYFTDARAAGHLRAMAWSLRQSLGDKEAQDWVAAHQDAVTAWQSWSRSWSPAPRGASGK